MRWIAKLLSLFIILLLIVISLTATIPLRFITDHSPKLPLPIQISDAQGTVVNGSLTLLLQNLPLPAKVNSKLQTLSVAWQWCPSFNIGFSAICIEADTELVQATFTTVLSTVGTELYDVMLLSTLRRLPIPVANGETEVSGDIQLSLATIVIPFDAPFPSHIQGKIVLQDVIAGIFKLGNFYLDLSSSESAELRADINGSGELFNVQGMASLTQDGRYRYNIDVESENSLVRSFLSQQGQANDKNGYSLAKTGNLPIP